MESECSKKSVRIPDWCRLLYPVLLPHHQHAVLLRHPDLRHQAGDGGGRRGGAVLPDRPGRLHRQIRGRRHRLLLRHQQVSAGGRGVTGGKLLQLQQGLGEQRRGGAEQLPEQRRRPSVQPVFSGATAGLALGQCSNTMRLCVAALHRSADQDPGRGEAAAGPLLRLEVEGYVGQQAGQAG